MELDDEVKILINNFFRSKFSPVSVPEEIWCPSTDIYTTDKGMVVRLELAGVEPKDIQIILEGKRLIVQGIRKDPALEHKRIAYQQMEITYGPFRSVFLLPSIVNPKEAQATYKNGFLEIGLPYAKEPVTEVVVINIK